MAGAVVMLAVGCGSQTPPPNPSGSLVPSSSPAVTSPAPSASAAPTADGSPGSDILAPERQPAFPGLYFPAGFLAQGTDHFALIQAPFDCPTLTDVLRAGQWTMVDRGAVVMPTQDPAQPTPAVAIPDFSLPEWLLLHWGDEYAVARVGGDENGCLAQVWRLSNGDYAAHGAIESVGRANALQTMCAAGNGIAEFGALYVGADGTFFSLQTTVPLKVGSHPIDQDTELRAGPVGPTVEMAFRLLFGGVSEEEQARFDIDPYFPEDPAEGWPGSIEVTSVDPLVGEIHFEGLRNEAGDQQTLSTGFRCDLRPGRLTAAAEAAANATPSPVPSPSPAPGHLSVDIAAGPHAGTQQLTSPDMTCSLGLFGTGDWTVSYNAPEYVAGEVQSLTVTAHANGKADVFMTLGDDFDRDWFNTDSAQAEVSDHGASVDIVVNGRGADSDFTIAITCYDIVRF